jgi:hypothetical protein
MVLGVWFIDSIPSCVPASSSTFFDSNGFSPEACGGWTRSQSALDHVDAVVAAGPGGPVAGVTDVEQLTPMG